MLDDYASIYIETICFQSINCSILKVLMDVEMDKKMTLGKRRIRGEKLLNLNI